MYITLSLSLLSLPLQVITGKDSLQVSGPPNHSQLRNIAIVNILHQFQTLIQEV